MKKILSIALSILLATQYAFAAPVGKISYAEGRVDLLRPGSDAAVPLREGDEVSVGDAVRTKSNSKAEITFDDKSTVRLAQNSKVDIMDYQLDENRARKSANIFVERGKARTIIAKMPDSAEFIISTPNARGKVKGSDIFTTYQSGSSGMLVAEGQLAVSGIASPQSVVMVPAGSSILVPMDETPKDPRVYLELEKKLYEADTNIPPKSNVEGGTIRGVIVKLSGDVRITKKGEASSRAANMNDILGEGDKVETGADGVIEIKFDNGNAMSLKPNSNVTVVTLVFNPQTGEYENLFESTAGRLKARIENLKGKSKFEVRTPSSICGARGTIMYINILPGMTQAFFEGGNGYINNLVSGMSKAVGMGENAFSDASGNVSDPDNTPADERESFSEGWEPGSGTEGYSAPESSVGDYFDSTGGDTGGGEGGGTGDTGDNMGSDTGTGNPIGIPFDPGTGIEIPPSMSLTATGAFAGDPASVLTAAVSSVDKAISSPWIGVEPFTVTGAYTNPNNQTLWSTDIEGTGSEGGSIQGWFGGSWHSWEGVLATLYVDPGGTSKTTGEFSHIAGFMFGYFTGTNSGGSFSGKTVDDESTKEIEGIVITPVNTTAILPIDLSAAISTEAAANGSSLYAAFDVGKGYIDAEFNRSHMVIEKVLTEDNMIWGIWKDTYTGTYKNPNGISSWTNAAGGNYGEEGYHYSVVRGVDNLDGALRIDISGIYLSPYKFGAYSGAYYKIDEEMREIKGIILGDYSTLEDSNFSAVGFGSFNEAPLTSSGRFASSLYGNGVLTGALSGLIGTTSDSAPMISIGTLTRNIAEPFIWFSDAEKGIYTNNPDNETYTTYDGGAFAGITAGFGRDNEMTGGMKGLYIGPDGSAGIFTSDLDGVYAASSGAYMLAGDITSEQVLENSGITAAGLYNSVFTTGGRGTISGSFTDGGALSADENFTTMSIANGTIAQSWGIYGQRFNGTFSDPATGGWTAKIGGADAVGAYHSEAYGRFESDYGYWLSDITGGDWAGGNLSAGFSGAFLTYTKMGAFSGDLFGIYNTDEGTWQGVGLGEWQTDALLNFTGIWGDSATTLYYNNDGYASPAGHDYGLIGSPMQDWWAVEGAFPVYAMGNYAIDSGIESNRFIWNTSISSYNALRDNYTTVDGGAFSGYTAGIWNNEVMDGSAAAIYISPRETIDGTMYDAGVLRGTLGGNYYPGVLMWSGRGELTPAQKAQNIGISSGDLENYIYNGTIYGSLAGAYENETESMGTINANIQEGSCSYFINDEANRVSQPWGIYSLKLGGSYLNNDPSATDWSAKIGGEGNFGYYYGASSSGNDAGYWLADIDGTWQNNEIEGVLAHGKFITSTLAGSMEGDLWGVNIRLGSPWTATSIGTWEGTPLTLSGTWGRDGEGDLNNSVYYNYYYNTDGTGYYQGSLSAAGHEWGLMGSAVSEWWGAESFPFIAMGGYIINDNMKAVPLIWNTEIGSYNAPDGNYTTLDGGAFYGYTAGIWNNNIMDGSVAAIYISPETADGETIYNAGILRGTTDAEKSGYYPGISMWVSEGSLTPTQISGARNIGISPADLGEYISYGEMGYWYGYLDGAFTTTDGGARNQITAELDWDNSYAYFINDAENSIAQPWGIYNLRLNGRSYSKPADAAEWSAKIGADGWWGGNSESGFWLADINGRWENNEIRGALDGRYITYSTLYSMEGGLRGVNNGDNSTWLAASVGTWQKTAPLTFSGDWNYTYSSFGDACIYSNQNGSAYDAGEDYGIIGSTAENWWVAGQPGFEVFVIGAYDDYDSAPYIWNTEISGLDVTSGEGGYATIDRKGAFFGLTAGIWKDGGLDGMLLALYADENGNLGYMRSDDLKGNYYPGISMWEAGGLVVPEVIEPETGLSPADFDYTSDSILASRLSGRFGDVGSGFGGSIQGDQYSGARYSVIVPEGGQERTWGLVNFILGSGNTFDRPEGKTTWEANMGAAESGFAWLSDWTGTWGNGAIKGGIIIGEGDYNFISDRSLGAIQAALYGIDNADNNTWIAAALGTFKEYDAAFISSIGNVGVTMPLFVNDYPQETDNGLVTSAMLGSVDSLWDGAAPYLFMGSQSLYYPGNASVWAVTDFYSRNSETGNNTTFDNGAYRGLMGGIFLNDTIEGRIAALYIEGAEDIYNAGYLLSTDMAGQMYPGLNMFKAGGNLIAHEVAQDIGIAPVDLYNSVLGSSGEGKLSAVFTDGGDITAAEDLVTMSIVSANTGEAQPWGIYGQKFIGEYSDPTEDWSGVIGGYDPIGAYYDEGNQDFYGDYGYWMADMTDGKFLDGRITAALSGTFITGTKMGDIDGGMLGVYSANENVWQAVGAGAWEGALLSFGGQGLGKFGHYDSGTYYVNLEYGSMEGLFGGLTLPWAGSSSITVMGEFINNEGYNLWAMDLSGWADGGAAITGTIGGTTLNSSLKGFMGGLYIRSVEGGYRAGYLLSSDIAGMFYPETLDMFNATGGLISYMDLPTVFSPSQLFNRENPATESGSFSGIVTGDVQGTVSGEGMNIADQGWGLWRAGLGGTFTDTPSADWGADMGGVDMAGGEPVGYWFGTLTGFLWADSELAGTVAGKSISLKERQSFEGNLIGVYDEGAGAWEALSLGPYVREELSHVSYISALLNTPVYSQTIRNEGDYKYYGDPDLVEEYKYFYYDNNKAGYSMDTDYVTGNMVEYYYYGDRNYRRGDYDAASDAWTYTFGAWSGNLVDLIATPPTPNPDETYSANAPYNYLDLSEGGNFSSGLLGGVDTITWGAFSPAEFIGEFHPDADLSKPWISDIISYNCDNAAAPNTTYDGGAYYGYLLGYGQQPAKGKFIALYIDPPDGLDVSGAGYLSGDFDGVTYANINMLNLQGDLFAKQMTLNAGISPADLPASLYRNPFSMSGIGFFSDGGDIQALVTGESLSIDGQRWGVWAAFMNGAYTQPAEMLSQNWSFALGSISDKGGYSLGTVDGNKWANGELAGVFNGVSFANDNETGKIIAMVSTGSVDGQYIEVDPGRGTWNAASAGEWVEVTELLTPEQLGFDAADLDRFVSVPITEVYSSIMSGSAILAAGMISLTMDLSLYATSQAATDGIVTALLAGRHSGEIIPGWIVTMNSATQGDTSAITVTNTKWADGDWLANMIGRVGEKDITGQAGGKYSADGTLTGAGAGTWTAGATE